MPTAYSYLRFSSPQQATGDSIRRQTQTRDAWLTDHPKVKLDTSLTLVDAGRSGFRRKNWDTYALAQFVKLIKSGRVEAGSYLLVENLDRLTREDAGEAVELFLSIVNRGVIIVQLVPNVMEFAKPVNVMSLMFAIVELSRGHSESAIKSERGRASWARKQKEAAPGRIVTKRLPGWISSVEGKLVLNEHAATVKHMFEMARDGEGTQAIALKLNAEKVPVMGRKEVRGKPVKWSGANVWHIITSRAAIGEYIPYRRRGGAAGSPVANYFPSVVDDPTFHVVRAAISTRGRVGRGRKGKHVNLFSGLLVDARDGGSLTYWKPGEHPAVLISVNAKEGKGLPWISFPAAMFDAAILSKLREVTAREIEGKPRVGKVDTLKQQRDEIDTLIEKWKAKMDNPDIVDAVAVKLAELHVRRKAIVDDLAEAERESATPLAESWREYCSLAKLLERDNSDETRLKVRTVLRQCIESVSCVIVSTKQVKTKIAAVRVQFKSGARREYLITALLASGPRPGKWEVRSFAARATLFDDQTGSTLPTGFDIRDSEQAARAERVLTKYDGDLRKLIDDRTTPRDVAIWLGLIEWNP
jgi:DNA invertase Pin-like site-specific DNA recombinase